MIFSPIRGRDGLTLSNEWDGRRESDGRGSYMHPNGGDMKRNGKVKGPSRR